MHGMSQPALVIKTPIAEDFEVLRLVAILRLRVRKRVDHAHALDRELLVSVDDSWLGELRRFKDRWRDVDHVMPL